MTDLVQAFIFHGLDLQQSVGDQYKGQCPFCGKQNHFMVKSGEVSEKGGQWDCKSCGEYGNVFTFMTRLFEESALETSSQDYDEMWELKRIPPAASKLCGICKSIITGTWMFPTLKSSDGKLSCLNIHTWTESTNKLMATTGVNLGLIGRHLLNQKKPKTLLFDEGHWDFAIMTHLLRSTKSHKEYDCLSTPGATTFKEDWLKFFDGYEEICFIYDGDHPRKNKKTGKTITPAGLAGVKKAVKLLREYGNESAIWVMKWPDGLKSGYDVRDLYIDKLDT